MGSIIWRWDQGREQYWRFSNIREIACTLVQLDGVSLTQREDPLNILRLQTQLPFATPVGQTDYTVWRQYARVFRALLLATRTNDKLAVTEICKKIADPSSESLTVDEYLFLFASRFYCDPPFGESYIPSVNRVYPVCVLIRYLLAIYQQGQKAKVDLETIFSKLIGNNCIGSEPLSFYNNLRKTSCRPMNNNQLRQVRELIKFISQFSFLHWDGNFLHLDLLSHSANTLRDIEQRLQPLQKTQESYRDKEILSLGKVGDEDISMVQPFVATVPLTIDDEIFVEGNKIRVTHLITERSRILRTQFFKYLSTIQPSIICDMGGCDLSYSYPWAENLLEIHHLMPLGSGKIVKTEGTSFKYLIPLCPNCHRGVHSYYRLWLRRKSQPDFKNAGEAKLAYEEAKSKVRIGDIS